MNPRSLARSLLLLLLSSSTALPQHIPGYNYDESQIPPYTPLDPLLLTNGTLVTTPAAWSSTRRPEILRLFEENVFGRTPSNAHIPLRPHQIELDRSALNGLAIRKQVDLYFTAKDTAGPFLRLLIYLPAHAPHPSPVILGLNFGGNQTVLDDPQIQPTPVWGRPKGTTTLLHTPPADSTRGTQTEEWQVRKILNHGYGLATAYYGDLEPDFKDASQYSIRQLFLPANQTPEPPDGWGAIGAWAWGLSRAMDYLQTDPDIDAQHVAVTGHSRLGKAADWAAAQDTRFAALLSTESGKAGQSLSRRGLGESVAHLQHSFPYWFCANYAQWVDHDQQIPADGNLLLSLIAPRPVYVASALGDEWSDPRGEFLSALSASRVYTLLGPGGLPAQNMPAADVTISGGNVAYHVRSGKHDVTAFDWDQYLAFLDTHFHPPAAPAAPPPVLNPAHFAPYINLFRQQELHAAGTLYEGLSGEDAWTWMQHQIPWFESSDHSFEEMYYFRWYAWHKHLVKTPTGSLITEWLPKPEFKDGSFGALPDAAPFHIAEARWLHDPSIAADDARYWFSPGVDSHKYSDALAWTVRNLTLAQGDPSLATSLLPAMIASYRTWESTQQDPNGLFWSIDTRDAMEKSISGDGYRPTLNSYMYADARAIAALTSDPVLKSEFTAEADRLHTLIETRLWNPADHFYEVLSPAADSGIRKQKKFADPGTTLHLSGVREQIGYIPWLFGIPAADHAIAWRQLFDPAGFDGKFGATTAERRSPRFRFPSSDQCTWNGPEWPFAMTQTLLALAAYENSTPTPLLNSADFYRLFERYVLAQHLKLASGEIVDWIDEDLDADTGEWIAKDMLLAKNKQVGRGNYYNHSGFADPLITGLLGLRPRADDTVELRPLLPPHTWTYFALDALPYHGHQLTLLWDPTGQRYHRGRGFLLLVDGRLAAQRKDLGPLSGKL